MNLWKDYKHPLIALILFLLIRIFIPASNGLTPVGVSVLAVLVAVLYLWITVGSDWVSLLALAALAITGLMTPNAIYSQSLGHFVVPVVITSMALTACLTDAGVTHKVATWFITRDFVRNKPYVFIATFLFSFWLLGLFMETVSLMILYIAFAKVICEDLGYEKGAPFFTVMMAGLMWNASVTSVATPIAHVLPLTMMGIGATMKVDISMGEWMMIGIPFGILMFILSILVIRFVWKPDTEKFAKYDIELMKSRSKPLSTEGKIISVVFVSVVLAWVFPQFGGSFAPGFAKILSGWGSTIPPILGIAVLCLIKINGNPMIKFAQIVKDVPLGVLIFMATVVVVGTAISSPNSGISVFLKNSLLPITQGMSPLLLIAFALFGTLLLTNFVSNTVSMILFFSVSAPLLVGSGINMGVLLILITMLAGIGIATPACSAIAPLFYGPEFITIKNSLKYKIVFLVGMYVLTVAVLYPLASSIMHF